MAKKSSLPRNYREWVMRQTRVIDRPYSNTWFSDAARRTINQRKRKR